MSSGFTVRYGHFERRSVTMCSCGLLHPHGVEQLPEQRFLPEQPLPAVEHDEIIRTISVIDRCDRLAGKTSIRDAPSM